MQCSRCLEEYEEILTSMFSSHQCSKSLYVLNSDLKLQTLNLAKPNYNISFSNETGNIGTLDFNGPEMIFTGNAEESAKVFFDWIAKSFKGRFESNLKWAKELPTKEGWYWYKFAPNDKIEVVELLGNNCIFVYETGCEEPVELKHYPKGEWYGPIEPPEYS